MAEIKTVLTDEQIDKICEDTVNWSFGKLQDRKFARAIEAAILAASAPAQEPVAWMITACGEVALHKERLPIAGNWTPLYAAPVDAQDAVDAKRYQFIRQFLKFDFTTGRTNPHQSEAEVVDEYIDSMIAVEASALQASQSPQDQVKDK